MQQDELKNEESEKILRSTYLQRRADVCCFSLLFHHSPSSFHVPPSCKVVLLGLKVLSLQIPARLRRLSGMELTQTNLPSSVSHLQARSPAERDRHAAAPQPGPADAPPRGLHSHLHRLCKLQPQAHRRGHLPAACRAQEAHRVFGVSELRRFINIFVMKSREDIVGVRKIFIVGL